MKKRSKYRPKRVLQDPVNWVLGGFKTLDSVKDQYLLLMIKIHDSLATLYKGKADRPTMDVVINAFNMAEALAQAGVGHEYSHDIRLAQEIFLRVAIRGVQNGDVFEVDEGEKYVLQIAIDVHDAQLNSCTIIELEKAIGYVKKAVAAKKARSVLAAVREAEAVRETSRETSTTAA
jgi:hypothetical protein